MVQQVLVPDVLRQRITELAHCSVMSDHLGIKKTLEGIMYNLHWPGIHGDVTPFCRSCDFCQNTIYKGEVTGMPLEKMPLVDTPFKSVAVDLVEPTNPPREMGHR